MATTPARAKARPPVVLTETDAERLTALALKMETRAPEVAGLLLGEVERAFVRPDFLVPDHVVRMGSVVDFVDEAPANAAPDGEGPAPAPRTVQLVYPGEADIAAGRISVLTHVGAGLIGLEAGQAILWPDRDGRRRPLRVLHVRPEPFEDLP